MHTGHATHQCILNETNVGAIVKQPTDIFTDSIVSSRAVRQPIDSLVLPSD